MSSSGNTASVNASVSHGWARTNNAIRSVASHPLALPLVLCLHFFDDFDTMDNVKGDRFMSYLQSLRPFVQPSNTSSEPRTRTRRRWPLSRGKRETTLQVGLVSQSDNVDPTIKLEVSGEHFMRYLQSLHSKPGKNPSGEDSSTKVQSVPPMFEKLMDMAWLVDDLKFMMTVTTVFSTFCLGKLHSDLKGVFNKMRRTGCNERKLVADIIETLRTCEQGAKGKNDSASSLLFQLEGDLTSIPNETSKTPTTSRYDLLVLKHSGSSCTPILMIEFGLNNSWWWKKLDQACNYLDLLTSPQNISPIRGENANCKIEPLCDKPVLMSTITIDKKTGAFKIALFLCWRPPITSAMTTGQGKMEIIHELVDQLSVSDKSTEDKARNKFSKGFDMILLWRTMWNPDDHVELHKSAEAEGKGSNLFANALVAIFFVMQCMKDWQTKDCSSNFLALGPNCCKVNLVQVR
jgi:hypothetical protein